MFDIPLELSWKNIAVFYFLGINILTFFSFAIDKMKSRTNSWRIPEKTLWFFTLLGGSPAALISMNYFRHKTKKISFQAGIILIIAIQVVLIFTFWKILQDKPVAL